jgi:hypothetical protein
MEGAGAKKGSPSLPIDRSLIAREKPFRNVASLTLLHVGMKIRSGLL